MQNYDYAGAFASLNLDNSKSVKDYVDNMQVRILDMNDEEMTFELIGVEPPIANALRRIMIAEVLKIGKTKIYQFIYTDSYHGN